jgi:hypothetical protein
MRSSGPQTKKVEKSKKDESGERLEHSEVLQMLEEDPNKLAERIARIAPSSIALVSIISPMGDIFGFYVNEHFRETFSSDRTKYQMIASRLLVGFGAAQASEKDGMVSETEAIVLIRRGTIHYYTPLRGGKEGSAIVAVWFDRKMARDIMTLSDQIRAFIGT